MHFLQPVDRLEFQILIDNVTDSRTRSLHGVARGHALANVYGDGTVAPLAVGKLFAIQRSDVRKRCPRLARFPPPF
jgi:hypothetical protein